MKLEECLKKKFVVTAEVQPAIEGDANELFKNVHRIRGKIDALTVPDLDIEGLVADTFGTCRALKEQNFEPIFPMACREKNRVEIQRQLLQAAELGIVNIHTFTQDYRITGDSLQEIMYFHVDTGKLYSVVNSLQQGVDINGKEIGIRPQFCIGSGVDCSWGKKVPDMELKEMETLANLGTHYFITTPVFDLDSFHQFMSKVGPLRVPVIAEIILVRSASMGLFLNKYVRPGLVPNHIIERLSKASDKEATSVEIIRDLVKGLKEVCQGVHFIPVGSIEKIHPYLEGISESL